MYVCKVTFVKIFLPNIHFCAILIEMENSFVYSGTVCKMLFVKCSILWSAPKKGERKMFGRGLNYTIIYFVIIFHALNYLVENIRHIFDYGNLMKSKK